jgi:polar amino acid transport system substrate-binding protein
MDSQYCIAQGETMIFINRLVQQAVFGAVLAAGIAGVARADGCEPAKLATKYPSLAGKTIKVGQDGESPPFSMRDPQNFDHLIGLDTDLARAVFKCAGVPVTFTTGSWSGLIPAAMSGQIDLMWDQLLYTPERAQKMDFVAYMNSATGVIVAKGNPHKITELGGLCGLGASANLGTTQEAMLRSASAQCVKDGKKPIDVITASDVPSSLRLVQSGRADALLANSFVAVRMVTGNPAVEVAFNVVTGAKLAAGTAKGNADLVKAIEDGLVVLRKDGTMKKIYEQYHVDYDLSIDPVVLTK